MIIINGLEGFAIVLPPTLPVMGARFVCSILMHLQVEGDMRQGLVMMKYAINHPKEFSNPFYAFFVALMQSMGGLASEICCIVFLCSLTDPINIIIRFVAFASIGKIDNFYYAALPGDNKLKQNESLCGDIEIVNHRREVTEKRAVSFYIGRFIFKSIRLLYASFIFYFLPYLAIFIPQIWEMSK